MENAEINNIIKILGLQYKKNYSDPESLKTLRYGKIMIMTDQVWFHYPVICDITGLTVLTALKLYLLLKYQYIVVIVTGSRWLPH